MKYFFVNPSILSPLSQRKSRAVRAIEIMNLLLKDKYLKDNRWELWAQNHKKMTNHINVNTLLKFQSDSILGPHIIGGSGLHFMDLMIKKLGYSKYEFIMKNYTETICGEPKDLTTFDSRQITRTSMRHIYHLAMLHDYCKNVFSFPIDFVEVGGGFGNLARLVTQYHLCKRYFIFDYPVTLAIQYFYLGEFFKSGEVAVISENGEFIEGDENSKIMLCVPAVLTRATEMLITPYAFVSTLALTEIPKKGQDEYLEKLNPALIYIYGQLQNLAVADGESAGKNKLDNNSALFSLINKYHTINYDFYGYNFEYMGRTFY
ncbi:MAG: hypothetical protein A2539_08435 [Elusimicrobia bacterium RIFOXYD2_FULL_34_15]|nr:MAG: hypothetical protein A2539_08435 [Elusimicrobia bacterium RIFOXYD2_FULL_34_15]HAM37835.1 hypothetical protein [Elusimicrobiota bacterium]